jgi:hypothetical protein
VGPPFLRLAGRNAAVAGLVVTYPEWQQTDVPPVPYPPCVESLDTENVGILDCCFLNPYEAIKLVRAHRHLVRNVTGYPSKRGIFVDECYDIGHIENIHFWPFGVAYNPEDSYCKWVNTQGVAFELARPIGTTCPTRSVRIWRVQVLQVQTGSASGNFLGLADSAGAVLVEQAQPPGLLITNGGGRPVGSTDSVCVSRPGSGRQGEPGQLLVLGRSTAASGCTSVWPVHGQCLPFVHWVNHAETPAIQLDAGRAIVRRAPSYRMGTRVVGAGAIRAVTSNQAMGGFGFENSAGPAQAFANEADHSTSSRARAHYRLKVGQSG